MDVTPTPTPPAKRTRAKAPTESAPKAPKVTVKAAKKPVATSTKKVESQIEVLKVPSRIADSAQLSADELRALIATAAYYRAAARNFSAGGEMEDWLAAEREILATVA